MTERRLLIPFELHSRGPADLALIGKLDGVTRPRLLAVLECFLRFSWALFVLSALVICPVSLMKTDAENLRLTMGERGIPKGVL